jgi:hypothetical protein
VKRTRQPLAAAKMAGAKKAAQKAFWDKPNPKKKSTPLTAAQKAAAKARAKKAGRPYPNLVDNSAVRKRSK